MYSRQIRYFGTGTQKGARKIARDVPRCSHCTNGCGYDKIGKGQHEAILKRFCDQADILIGTQMIAKGLDYPNVTLVGSINADTALNIPDFKLRKNIPTT